MSDRASPDVVLLCHFDGVVAIDVSSYAHPLTKIGSVQLSATNQKFGNTALFSDPGSALDTGNATHFQFFNQPFTIECWAYFAIAPPSVSSILSTWGDNNLGWYFGIISDHLTFAWSTTGADFGSLDVGSGPALNQWLHLVAERDPSDLLRFYVNGVVVGTAGLGGVSINPSPMTCRIGSDHYSTGVRAIPGSYLDEVRIVRGTAMYGGAFTPPTAPYAPAEPLYAPEEAVQLSPLIDLTYAGPYRVGNEVHFVVDGRITQARFYRTSTTTVTSRSLFLYDASGTLVATTNASVAESGGGWVQLAFPAPIPVAAGSNYVISVDVPDIFSYGGSAPNNTNAAHAIYVQGRYGDIGTYPAGLVAATNYSADVIWQPLVVTVGAITGALAVTEAIDTIAAAGSPRVSGTLVRTQDGQNLAASGSPVVGADLSATQASQTLAATGIAVADGRLGLTQDAQTLHATATAITPGRVTQNISFVAQQTAPAILTARRTSPASLVAQQAAPAMIIAERTEPASFVARKSAPAIWDAKA